MDNIVKEKFLINDPYFFCQYVRGELFIVVDAILSSPDQLSASEQKLAVEFLEAFIKFFLAFLDILPQYLKEVEFSLENE
jgi:hypothetical protein